MTEVEERLAAMFEAMGEWAPHDPDLLATALRDRPRRWPSPRVTVSAAAAAVVVGVAVPVLALGGDHRDPEPAGYSCPATLAPETLPDWARDGFSDPAVAPYVIGADSSIVGVVFADPLLFPPAADKQNKVLWVPREGGGELTVSGRLVADSPPVVIESTTGPSVLDLPAAGCWHLDLTWPGGSDSVTLRVAEREIPQGGSDGTCSDGAGDGAVPGLAWWKPLHWAGVVDHVLEVTATDLPPETVQSTALADLSVDVDRVLWSRQGAADLPDDLTLSLLACSVGPATGGQEPNWVPGQHYVAAVLLMPKDPTYELPERWAPLSPGSVFAYDDGVLDVHEGLFLDRPWQQRLVGQAASALVAELRHAQQENADLLAPLSDEPDPYVRSSILLGRG
jgi:hypothetical protein